MAQGRLPRSQSHVSMLHKELPFLTVHLAVPAANGWLISLHMPSFTLMAISVTSPLQTCCHMRSRFRPPIVVRRDRGGVEWCGAPCGCPIVVRRDRGGA